MNTAINDLKGFKSAEEIVKQIKRYGENSSIKAVILRLDSPGGAVAPSQEIYSAIKKNALFFAA